MVPTRPLSIFVGRPLVGEDQRISANYRPDIDGLRAIAVIAVMMFHLDFATFGGGFIGVDIFFVISGYLIGKSILDQRRSDSFTFTNFYQKRLRRIIPALVTVLFVTTLFSLFILLPVALVEYGESLIAAVYSLANVLFWLEAGYFDNDAHAKPLLHTWSLGVEEQFYIVFPIILFFTRKATRFDNVLLTGLALASLSASIAIAESNSSANFYLIPTRGWELLLGVLAAEWRFRLLERRVFRELLGSLALATLGVVCLAYNSGMTFPGISAVPPVVATAVLLSIGAHGPSFPSRLLALRPVVWVGLLSYSLYLWHWPIIVLIKQWLPEAWLRMPERGIALGLTFFLAWLSWRFVERPFRSRTIPGRTIWWFSGTSAAALTLIGVGLIATGGLPQRLPERVVQFASYLDHSGDEVRNPCIISLFAPPGSFVPNGCFDRASDRPNVLIIGDSHANHLRWGLERRYPDIAFQQATAAGCRVTLAGASRETATCAAFRSKLFEDRLTKDPPEWVVIGQFWGDEPFTSLEPTIKRLKALGIKIILAGPVARYEVPLPQVLAMAELRGDPSIIDRMRVPGAAEADARFARFAQADEVEYMSSYQSMCPRGKCITHFDDGEPIQTDSHHLGKQGSLLVAENFPYEAVKQSWAAQRPN